MAFNKNEVLLDRVRSLTCHDLETNKMLLRLTSLEEPSLNTTAEGEEVTDAIGALITTLYRAKRATFSASNSLVSLDLAAAQYGSNKQVTGLTEIDDKGTKLASITDYAYEILTVGEDGTVALANKVANDDDLKWVYSIVDNQVGTHYEQGAVADGGFTVGTTEKTVKVDGVETTKTVTLITLPETEKGKKIYVEYTYESENALKVVNKASDFPAAVSVVIYAYFRDVCNENKIYSGKIICPKAKLNPESIELALTSTGKHPFEFVINRDYCAEEGEDTLFEIILSE